MFLSLTEILSHTENKFPSLTQRPSHTENMNVFVSHRDFSYTENKFPSPTQRPSHTEIINVAVSHRDFLTQRINCLVSHREYKCFCLTQRFSSHRKCSGKQTNRNRDKYSRRNPTTKCAAH